MSQEEDPFAEVKALQRKLIKAEEANTQALNKLNTVIGFQHGRTQSSGGSSPQLSELKTQTDILKQLLLLLCET